MQYAFVLLGALATTVFAYPSTTAPLHRRAGVLGTATYDDLSISGGTAGNCEAEALAKFSALDLNDMANIDEADIKFLGAVNDIANDAETDAFNVAIDAASGDEKTALQVSPQKQHPFHCIMLTMCRTARSRTSASSSWPPNWNWRSRLHRAKIPQTPWLPS